MEGRIYLALSLFPPFKCVNTDHPDIIAILPFREQPSTCARRVRQVAPARRPRTPYASDSRSVRAGIQQTDRRTRTAATSGAISLPSARSPHYATTGATRRGEREGKQARASAETSFKSIVPRGVSARCVNSTEARWAFFAARLE